MNHFWLFLWNILLFIIAPTTATTNVELGTQQGIIYGRQTENSIEYLGYNKTNQFNNFFL
jgi:hypothetical protein